MEKKGTQKEFIVGLLGIAVAIAVIFKFCGGNKSDHAAQSTELSKTAYAILPDSVISVSILNLKTMDNLIADAAVSQKDDTLSLAIIVNPAMRIESAKEYAEAFVRQIMTNAGSLENVPGKEIGISKFNYTIGIYRQDKTEIASGYKASNSKEIQW